LALLGSSLVVVAMSECDATVQKQPLDLCFYRKDAYLDQQLKKRFGCDYRSINLAAPGQIPSDAYLTLEAALKNGIKPGALIYGLAPRDFIDGTLQNAYDTEPFQYLSHIVDVRNCAGDIYRNPISQVDWGLKRGVFLYGASTEILQELHDQAWRDLNTFLTAQTGGTAEVMQHPVKPLIPSYQLFDMAPGSMIARADAGRAPCDNTQDYKDRYKNPNLASYKNQFGFLERLITLCQRNDIELVLVNMPVTPHNLSLLGRQWHERYLRDVAHVAAVHNITYIDECTPGRYQPEDFHDIVHLTGKGGKKFIDNLVEKLSAAPNASAAMIAAGEQAKRTMATTHGTNL
ncbi:MAG: hypothetical protein ACRD3W_25735, partial [Terriglobales bacterium]